MCDSNMIRYMMHVCFHNGAQVVAAVLELMHVCFHNGAQVVAAVAARGGVAGGVAEPVPAYIALFGMVGNFMIWLALVIPCWHTWLHHQFRQRINEGAWAKKLYHEIDPDTGVKTLIRRKAFIDPPKMVHDP